MRNGNAVPQVVARAMKSRTPVTRFTTRLMATARNTQRKADSGMFRLMPSKRRSSTQLAPTSTAMPMVCSVSTVG